MIVYYNNNKLLITVSLYLLLIKHKNFARRALQQIIQGQEIRQCIAESHCTKGFRNGGKLQSIGVTWWVFYLLFSQDGRLQIDDQLLVVNGISLLKKANVDAMVALRLAMQKSGPDFISVVVARIVCDKVPKQLSAMVESEIQIDQMNISHIFGNVSLIPTHQFLSESSLFPQPPDWLMELKSDYVGETNTMKYVAYNIKIHSLNVDIQYYLKTKCFNQRNK